MADSKIPSLLIDTLKTLMSARTVDDDNTDKLLYTFQERATRLLCLAVHNTYVQSHMMRNETYLKLFRILFHAPMNRQENGAIVIKRL